MTRLNLSLSTLMIVSMSALAPLAALSQAQPPVPAAAPSAPSYGATVPLEMARRAAAAALAEAARNGWQMSVAIVDTAGQLVHFEKMDDCQSGSIQVSIDKARSAALFRRPTKVFGDMLAAGNSYVMTLAGAVPVERGVPLVLGGKVVGAIGISGGTGPQDGTVARAGAEQLR